MEDILEGIMEDTMEDSDIIDCYYLLLCLWAFA